MNILGIVHAMLETFAPKLAYTSEDRIASPKKEPSL